VVSLARKSFADDKTMQAWMEEQLTILLSEYVSMSIRKPHKHDSLLGVICDVPEVDIKRVHLKEKYGI